MSAFLPDTVRFLQKVCALNGYQLTVLDPHSGYLAEVRHANQSFLTGAGKVCAYPLNTATACTIAQDKAHTATLLDRAGVRVPRGQTFFLSDRWSAQRGTGRDLANAVGYARTLGFPVVAKPVDGSQGAFVRLCMDEATLEKALQDMAPFHPVALVQDVVHGPEYRIVTLDGDPVIAYRRTAATLKGDGVSTISALLDQANGTRKAHGLEPLDGPASVPDGYGPDDIPAPGQELPYLFAANISAGGSVTDVRATFSEAEHTAVRQITDAIGLRVAGLDVLTAGPPDDPAGWTVLEVNGNPSLAGLAGAGYEQHVISLWREICRKVFGT